MYNASLKYDTTNLNVIGFDKIMLCQLHELLELLFIRKLQTTIDGLAK